VPPAGASYLEASLLHARTGDAYDATGARVPFRRLGDVERPTTYADDAFVLFAEVGLGGGFAVEGDVAFRRVAVDEPATRFRSDGPGDVRVMVKRGFRRGPLALAASAEARAPLGYDRGDYPALGAGELDGALQAHAGLGFAGGWAQAEAGLRHRGGPAADEWPFAAQAGLQLAPAWSAVFDVRGHGRLGTPDPPAPGATFDPARASSSVLQAGPGVAFAPVPGLRLSAQAWRSLSGRNMPAGWKWKLAVARVR
jgi:hypothetical protein